jgi:hypothetical protein
MYQYRVGDIVRITGDQGEGVISGTVGLSGFIIIGDHIRPTVRLVRNGERWNRYAYQNNHLELEYSPERLEQCSLVVERQGLG